MTLARSRTILFRWRDTHGRSKLGKSTLQLTALRVAPCAVIKSTKILPVQGAGEKDVVWMKTSSQCCPAIKSSNRYDASHACNCMYRRILILKELKFHCGKP